MLDLTFGNLQVDYLIHRLDGVPQEDIDRWLQTEKY